MKKYVAIACMLTTLLVASSANAFTVTTSVGTFDVSIIETKYNEMGTPELFAMQPWWGSSILAQEFRDAVDNNLGFPNVDGDEGPWFAYLIESDAVFIQLCTNADGDCSLASLFNDLSTEGFYAIAAPVPVPAAAWLFMSGLIGLLWKGRKARQSVT